MTYFQYLFSDKKAKVYWISVYGVIFGFPVLALFLYPELIKELNFRDILNVLGIVIIYGSIYVGFYTSGYLNSDFKNDLIIRFSKSVNAINKMVIKDFKKYMRTNR